MAGMTSAQRIVSILDNDRVNAKENATALRLQAKAWQLLCIIACHDPEYAKGKARSLFFFSVPFVDGPAFQQFIDEHMEQARECGLKTGIFTNSQPAAGEGGE